MHALFPRFELHWLLAVIFLKAANSVYFWSCRPKNCPDEIFSVMSQCHSCDADRRPTFTDIFTVFIKKRSDTEMSIAVWEHHGFMLNVDKFYVLIFSVYFVNSNTTPNASMFSVYASIVSPCTFLQLYRTVNSLIPGSFPLSIRGKQQVFITLPCSVETPSSHLSIVPRPL